jgi:NTE family protein
MQTDGHPQKHITLALQGGGAHGAFTWGVLDRLLEEPAICIEAISGTSAGAMNAAVMASGLIGGGPEAAKKALYDFWKSVSVAGDSVFDPSRYLRAWPGFENLASIWSDVFTHVWSPYDNPYYKNGLRRLVSDAIDFKRLSTAKTPRVFICATNVRTNERTIFKGARLTPDALLASACIPTLFRAVDVGGQFYWDGGYMGNPVLEPLLAFCQDLVIVEVNAFARTDVPKKADDIMSRLNEITFNSALVQEIRGIETMNKLLKRGQLRDTKYKTIRFHVIESAHDMAGLGARSKNNTDWSFLLHLRDLGRESASFWLEHPGKWGKVGHECTVDVDEKFIRRSLNPEQIEGEDQSG